VPLSLRVYLLLEEALCYFVGEGGQALELTRILFMIAKSC